ncbi:IS110 family transposase [Lactobacillus gallinarum]|uniref:IS110 family transposase n=2 Tax=Lactobacillus gallinarum TaxID=52242 RepID=UPI0019593EB4|nr:IS110 family transposase [Lactobacillus gallinarum]MBM6957815.1 IS110 family transposase [Lactobacillus gallinarum]
MQVTFGIDVSKSTSTVCELIGESKNELTITNNHPGFIQLLNELTAFSKHPQIIFEATGVYSRRLQSFLEDYGYDYVIINPLKAKKEMDMGLRHNKTDKTDAYHLALIQRLYHHPINQLQSQTYKQLNSLSRFYNQLTADLVMAKNRLHQALQSTFPEIENLFSAAKGKNYWQIVNHYPHCDLVRKADKKQIITWLTNLKGIAFRHAQRTADKLIKLAHQAYPVVSCSSIEVEQVQYYAHRLLNLSEQRKQLIARMVKLAKTLPNHDLENLESIPGFAQTTAVRVLAELGDLRRFSNPNKINAFIGIDPGRYQSGEMDSNLSITKHGNAVARKLLYRAIGQIDLAAKTNPCHIADYYESKKLSSQTKGFKKIAIASIHKLIRTIYALIINDQLYDYNVATHNQKDFSRN